MDVPFLEQVAAATLLEELQQTRLVVVKYRTEQGWQRVAISSNPVWYQEFCAQYVGRRKRYPKLRTIIRRKNAECTLRLWASGIVRPDSMYYPRLKPFIERMLDCI